MKPANSYGWAGTVLKIDLTRQEIQTVPTKMFEPEKYIGGQGLCNKVFWDMGCPKIAPLDPENPLMISVGPLTGIPGPFNRAEICGIGLQNYPEPQFTYSGFGGKFPSSMKYAGYDLMVITGKAETPVYIEISDNEVQIKDATGLWGLDRGFGAVMGSKNLKAVAVKGTGSVKIAHPETFRKIIAEVQAKGNWSKGAAQPWGRQFLWGGDQVEVIEEHYRKNYAGPYGCPYQCYGFYDVPGEGKGAVFCAHWWYGYTNPNKESARANVKASMLSQKLGINGYEMLTLIRLMNDTIKDQILTKAEWEEIAGVRLPEWLGGTASEDVFLETLLQSIASGKSVFSQGIKRAMDQIAPEVQNSEALQKIVDIEYPAWGYPQHYYGWIGLLLHVALDVRDAGNSTDEYLSLNRPDNVLGVPPEELGKHFDVPYGMANFAHAPGGEEQAVWEGVERQTQFTLIMQSLRNSCPICNFASLPDSYFFPPELDYQVFLSRVLSAVTGCDLDVNALVKIGERIWNMRRAVIIEFEGRTREADRYLDNFYDVVWEDPHDSGTEERLVVLKAYVDKKKFEALKNRYYQLAGWDEKTGWPTRKKLEELDLKDVADKLLRDNK